MIRIALAALAIVLGTAAAISCEEFKTLSADEMKEYRDKLSEQGADPLDQLFAFEELSCSDSPTIRAYAMKTGLQTATDPLVLERLLPKLADAGLFRTAYSGRTLAEHLAEGV